MNDTLQALDQVMVNLMVKCMLNRNNKTLYIGNLTLDKVSSFFAEMPHGDVRVADVFWTAFGIAQSIYLKNKTEQVVQTHDFHACPECGCHDYVAGVKCPNCDYDN